MGLGIVLLTGCGPFAIGVGVSSALDSSSTPDVGETDLDVAENVAGSVLPPKTLVNWGDPPLRVTVNRATSCWPRSW